MPSGGLLNCLWRESSRRGGVLVSLWKTNRVGRRLEGAPRGILQAERFVVGRNRLPDRNRQLPETLPERTHEHPTRLFPTSQKYGLHDRTPSLWSPLCGDRTVGSKPQRLTTLNYSISTYIVNHNYIIFSRIAIYPCFKPFFVSLEPTRSDAIRGASEACNQNVCLIHCGSKRAK